eukprot:8453880-Pyramimonas_sp.AAC.1
MKDGSPRDYGGDQGADWQPCRRQRPSVHLKNPGLPARPLLLSRTALPGLKARLLCVPHWRARGRRRAGGGSRLAVGSHQWEGSAVRPGRRSPRSKDRPLRS